MSKLHRMILILGIIMLPLLMLAETDYGQILEINIEGNNRIEKELIKSLLAFDIGDYLSPDNTSKSIHNLYQLEVFDDVSISSTIMKQGIVVTVHLKEFPVIRRLKFKGNKKIKDSKLEELVIVETGNYYAPYIVPEIKNRIMVEYQTKGYHYAQINFEENFTDDYVDLTIDIDEGEKIVIRKITIHGNHDIPTKKLLSKMSTKKAGFFRSGKLEEEKYQEDLDKIIKFYNKKGYIDAHIISQKNYQTMYLKYFLYS